MIILFEDDYLFIYETVLRTGEFVIWTNNLTMIIEFGFREIWRIVQIWGAFIHLGPPFSTPL